MSRLPRPAWSLPPPPPVDATTITVSRSAGVTDATIPVSLSRKPSRPAAPLATPSPTAPLATPYRSTIPRTSTTATPSPPPLSPALLLARPPFRQPSTTSSWVSSRRRRLRRRRPSPPSPVRIGGLFTPRAAELPVHGAPFLFVLPCSRRGVICSLVIGTARAAPSWDAPPPCQFRPPPATRPLSPRFPGLAPRR